MSMVSMVSMMSMTERATQLSLIRRALRHDMRGREGAQSPRPEPNGGVEVSDLRHPP